MPTVTLSTFAGVGAQLFDNSGNPLSGGLIETYEAGTTTPLATYTTSAGNVAHSNPIVLNSAGRVPSGEIWVDYTKKYKFVVKTSTGVLIATYDNVGGSAIFASSVANFNGNGVQIAFVLAFPPINANSTQVYINGVYQQKNTYSLLGATLTFSEAPPLSTTIEVTYV